MRQYSTNAINIHLKFEPSGPAFLAENPGVSQTGDRTKLNNCLTSGKKRLERRLADKRFNSRHLHGAMPGTTCMAEEPEPITATTLSVKSTFVSQAAVCNNVPLNDCKPSTLGHFQTLVGRELAFTRLEGLRRAYFKAPPVLRRISASSMMVLPSGRWTSQIHFPFLSSQVLCRTWCCSLTNLFRSNLSAVSWRYFNISLAGE